MELLVKHALEKDDILDILTTAIEGGIGYWACLRNDDEGWAEGRKQWKEEHKDDPDPIPCYCDVAYKVMEMGKAVKFTDAELYDDDPDLEYWELTMEKFLNGCALFIAKTGKDIQKAMEESDFDAEDADMIIQYALFGELVFG